MRYLICILVLWFNVAFSQSLSVGNENNNQPSISLTPLEKKWKSEHQNITLYIDDNLIPYSFVDDYNRVAGVVPEFMALVANYAGLKINLLAVPTEQWLNYDGNAEVHGIGPAVASEMAYPDHFLYVKGPLKEAYGLITATPEIYTAADIKNIKGKRIGLYAGMTPNQYGFSDKNEYVHYRNAEDAFKAILEGKLDGYYDVLAYIQWKMKQHLVSGLRFVYIRDVGDFNFVGVSNRYPELQGILNKAIEKASMHLPQILEKWSLSMEDNMRQTLLLTDQEKQWLKQHPKVRVIVDSGWAPVEYLDERGHNQGISIDYVRRLEAMLGIRFEILKGLTWQEGLEAVQNKKADMFPALAYTEERAEFVNYNRPHLKLPIRIYTGNHQSYIGSIENLGDMSVGVVKDYALHQWLKDDYPELNLVPVPSPKQALQMIAQNELDAFIGNVVVATYYINKYQLDSVRDVGETPYEYNLSMAVRNDWLEFTQILQKALDSIPAQDRKDIFNSWMSIRFERTVDYGFFWGLLAMVVIVLLLVVYWYRKKAQREIFKEQSRIHDVLEGTNAGIWEWKVPTDSLTVNERWAQIIGYQLSELEPITINTWKESLHPDDLANANAKMEKLFAKELDYYDVEFRQKHKNGEWVWINARGKVVAWNNDGTPLRMSGTHLDITPRKQAEETILYQAHYDQLTGLPNRFLLLDRLGQQIREASRSHKKVALFFIDLDDFKKINDTLGHETGDRLLKETAQRLKLDLREEDTLGHLGGDDFVAVVGSVSEVFDVQHIAQKLLSFFKSPKRLEEREIIVTASLGIAMYPDDGSTGSELLRNAESAMYHAKREGRSTFAFFAESMNQNAMRRLQLEEQMHGALERGEFELFYQPKVCLRQHKIIGVEALLRWHNPALGNVSPAEFIPVAEDNGMIIAIGEYVITEALKITAWWHRQFGHWYSMAINLSPRQFRDPSLVSFIEQSIKTIGVPSDVIELEITEGVLMLGQNYIDDALNKLCDMGISLAMDDFGTGYSSLSYLRAYPFHVLKIDRTFVMDITQDKADLELVNAAIAMAHSLNMTVVAEGIETVQQLDILTERQCDIAQGYLFSKPVDSIAIAKLLEEGLNYKKPETDNTAAN